MGVKNLEKNIFVSNKLTKEKDYWINKLSGELERSNFPYDNTGLKDIGQEYESIQFEISGELFLKLNRIANNSDKNMFVILLAGVTILLQRYTGIKDVIIGTPIFRQETEGEYINTVLSLRNLLTNEMTFKDLIIQVKKHVNDANENLNYPIERLISILNVPSEAIGFPLFDTVVLLENIHERSYIERINSGTVFSFYKGGNSLRGSLEYKACLYKKETIERIVLHFLKIIGDALGKLNDPISEIEIFNNEEKSHILHDFNNTYVEFNNTNKTICNIFEEQVRKTPQKTAVVFGEKKLTYQQLNTLAAQLAHKLKGMNICKDKVVGLLVEHSLEMIIGILGVLKAEGAFLPIDPQYPSERIKYILNDSKARALLIQNGLQDKIEFEGSIINLEDNGLYSGDYMEEGTHDAAEGLSYVIYTSGTTGLPKGVMIENRNLVNYATWFAGAAGLNSNDKTILLSSFCFDLGYTSIFPALLNGCELHIVLRESYLDSQYLLDYINLHSITYIKSTPSLFSTFVNSFNFSYDIKLSSLRLLVLGGERINTSDMEKFLSIYPKVRFMNHYGPTETTIGCIYKSIDPYQFEEFRRNPVIGKPIDNTEVYILNDDLKPMPIGTVGEIFICGKGVARGYLNNRELELQRFVNIEIGDKNKHLYRTGDLGKYLPDGNIQFVGRKDSQIKIKGFRVELSEIEKLLLKHPLINDAVVIDIEEPNGGKLLCACIVSTSRPTVNDLKEYLSRILPEYMIPGFFIFPDKIPLTQNNKVDRGALVQLKEKMLLEFDYEAPRNEIEERLAEVWQEVLGLKKIGINNSFFDLGGDSIKAIQITSRLQKYSMKMEIKDLFEHPTICELSGMIKTVSNKASQQIVDGRVQLSPIQKKFFKRNFTNKHHWNQSVVLFNKQGFDKDILSSVFSKIIEHHDALRMVFKMDGANVEQYNQGLGHTMFDMEVIELYNECNLQDRITHEAYRIQGNINLSEGPLVKLGLFKTDKGDHLLIAIHHLVIDGVSWRILFEDLEKVYLQILRGEPLKLQDKTCSFKHWTVQLYEYTYSRKLLKETDYWKDVEQTLVERLPRDGRIESNRIDDSYTAESNLNNEETNNLLKHVNNAFNTEVPDILLTALGLALKEWANNDRFLLRLEGHGREDILEDVDITRTIGWFTSEFPFVLDMGKSDHLGYQIKHTKECLRAVPNKGIGYGILKYLTHEEDLHHMGFRLEPEISFNYLGQFDQDVKTDIFELSKLSGGLPVSRESEREYTFYINLMIVDGILRISFNYNKSEYREDTVIRLINCYTEKLRMIMGYCMSRKENELTPTDMGSSEISIEELDSLNEFFRNL